jgi:outer membrane protein OmpA-like peptidoglycan-associated protein
MRRTAFAACLLALAGFAQARAPQIRIEPGLVAVGAIRDAAQGIDYESVSMVIAVSDTGIHTSSQWSVPDAKAPSGVQVRKAESFTRAEDLQKARRIILSHLSSDPDTMPGTTQVRPSAELFDEIKRTGEAQIVLGAVSARDGNMLGGLFAGRKYFRGTLRRIGFENVRVLVDGVPELLPALHVKGTLAVGDDQGEAEFWWLDDAQAPIALKAGFQGSVSQTVRINRPGKEALQDRLTGEHCRSEVPGIYFLTNSAQLLEASRPAVERIAALLRVRQEWIVTLEGHTDNIGGDAANLDLSRRRAEALKSDLASRYGIAPNRLRTAGYGSKHPLDSNATIEGRARNRRVEVSRPC